MGSAAITAAAATTDDPVRQGYINMTGTFWDTIVVCTITGLCIASSGVLGITSDSVTGTYNRIGDNVAIVAQTVSDGKVADEDYLIKKIDCNSLTLISNNLKTKQQNYS